MIGENGFLKTIRLKNFLSFGEDSEEIELKSLNVLIGANASGKSNLIEALRLLRAAPQKGRENDIENVLNKGGGLKEWIWKGGPKDAIASVEVITDSYKDFDFLIRYTLGFRVSVENTYEQYREKVTPGQLTEENEFNLIGESLIRQKIDTPDLINHQHDYFFEHGSSPSLVTYASKKEMSDLTKQRGYLGIADVDSLDLNRSILSQRDDYERFPNVSYLSDKFLDIIIYQDWDLSISSPIKAYLDTNVPPDFLKEDASNLALILNYLLEKADTSKIMHKALQKFTQWFEDIIPSIRGGEIQYRIRERGLSDSISMKRLSEGYIRFLCLLAILIHPEPPAVICIEEPEQCMHPDIIPLIAELLIDASHRTQLFVTTHSDHLISALTDVPESVIVCNRVKSGTHLKRLEKEPLKEWLKEYTLGDLWRRGEIGGIT